MPCRFRQGFKQVLVEVAFACVIAYAVALAQATRRTILKTGSAIGPVQAVAAAVCAALVPALLVYSIQFHTAWTLGVDAQSESVHMFLRYGFEVSILSALGLFAASAGAYVFVARRLLAGKKLAWLGPATTSLVLLLIAIGRGTVGGRFTGADPPPVLIATGITLVFLIAAILAANRFDLDEHP